MRLRKPIVLIDRDTRSCWIASNGGSRGWFETVHRLVDEQPKLGHVALEASAGSSYVTKHAEWLTGEGVPSLQSIRSIQFMMPRPLEADRSRGIACPVPVAQCHREREGTDRSLPNA